MEASQNPFAAVVMVHLRTLETTNDREARKVYKLALIKRLYEQGFSKQDIINLYNLIDWMMTLTKDLEREFQQELKQYEEEKKMPYITSIERAGQLKGQLEGELIGEQRGEQRGELKGEQNVIIRLLNHRIGEIQPPVIEQIRKLSLEQLEELTDVLLTFSTIADLEKWLKARPKPVEA